MAKNFNWNSMPEVNRPSKLSRTRRGPKVMDMANQQRSWSYSMDGGLSRTVNRGQADEGVLRTIKRS